MSSEAKFVLSYNFTTVRGDSYEEFVHNCQQAFGGELGLTVVSLAMAELAQHFTGSPTVQQAEQVLINTLGAQEVPQQYAQPAQFQAVPQPGFNHQQAQPQSAGFVFLNIPFAQKDYAKQNGARWDKDRKAWYVPAGHPLSQQFPSL